MKPGIFGLGTGKVHTPAKAVVPSPVKTATAAPGATPMRLSEAELSQITEAARLKQAKLAKSGLLGANGSPTPTPPTKLSPTTTLSARPLALAPSGPTLSGPLAPTTSRPPNYPPPPVPQATTSRPPNYAPPPVPVATTSRPPNYAPPPVPQATTSRPPNYAPPPVPVATTSRPPNYAPPPVPQLPPTTTSLPSTTNLVSNAVPASAVPTYPANANLITTANGIQIPGGTSPASQQLGQHIANAADAYKTGDYRTAHDMLTDMQKAKANNLALNITSETHQLPLSKPQVGEIVEGLRSKNFAFDGGKIRVIDPMFKEPKDAQTNPIGLVGLSDQPKVAKRVLPMQLEEWMHQHQTRLYGQGVNGGYISKLTPAFAAQNPTVGNLNEVDILASFHQWGLPVRKLGTIEQYSERKAFWEWAKANGHAS